MERLTKRISENLIELSAKANPIQYNGKPQRVHIKHPFWNVFNKLCAYEDAENRGLMLILPVPIGTTVYDIKWWDNKWETVEVEGKKYSRNVQVHKISKSKFSLIDIDNFGKTVFLTKAEAEKALAEMD